MVILFAAGNEGADDGTIGCPATSKNAITVGASNFKSNIASFSSRGPVDDGRFKPDLVAPGVSIWSTLSHEIYPEYNYQVMSGTSMATPHVAGITALVREFIQNNWSYSNPSSSLIKGLLINGAYDLTNNGGGRVDNNQGWGLVDLKNSISPDKPKKIFYVDKTTGIQTDEKYTYDFNINSKTLVPLRITLAWSDYPGSVSSNVNLVNDLDLILRCPNGSVYHGNDFTAPFDSSFDRINNVEGIDIITPSTGEYSIEVFGYNIPMGPQDFSLIVSYGDEMSPQIDFVSPLDNGVVRSSDFTLNISLDDFGSVNCSLDGGEIFQMNSIDNLSFYHDFSNLPEAEHYLDFVVSDSNGFVTDIERLDFSVNLPLTMDVFSPVNGSIFGNSLIFVNASLSEAGSVLCHIDSSGDDVDLSSSDNLNFNGFLDLTDGNYSITILGSDSDSDDVVDKTRNFIVDLTAPQINIISPLANNILKSSNHIINISLNEAGSVWGTLNNGITNFSFKTHNNSTFYYNMNDLGLTDGFYNMTIFAKDNAKNLNSDSVYFGLDINPLNIIESSLSNNSIVSASKLSIPLKFNFSKDLNSLSYTINNIRFDISDKINGNKIESNIDILRFGKNELIFSYCDEFNNCKNSSLSFNATLSLNSLNLDFDGDGLNDSLDKIVGNVSNINSDISNLSLKINSSSNLNSVFSSTLNVSFMEGNKSLIEFENNFSQNKIDLTNITVKKANISNSSKIFIRGLQLKEGKTKTLYLDLIGNKSVFGSLCLRDEEIFSFEDLDSNCNGDYDIYIPSVPFNNGIYKVSFVDSSNSTVKIEGLSHSAVSQMCSENWQYSDWSSCSDNIQTRTAVDLNNCGTEITLQSLSQSCNTDNEENEDNEEDNAPSQSSGGGGGGSSSSSSFNNNIKTLTNITTVSINSNTNSNKASNLSFANSHIVIKPSHNITTNYKISISGNSDLKKNYTGLNKVAIRDKNNQTEIISFDFNFSKKELDLSYFNFNIGKNQNKSYIIVTGLDLENFTKSVKIERLNKTSKNVCIADKEIESINEISNNCNGMSESLILCDGKEYNGYKCIIEQNDFIVSGLKHSAVLEFSDNIDNIISENSKNDNLSNKQTNNISLNNKDNENSNFKFSIIFVYLLCFIATFIVFIFGLKYLRNRNYDLHDDSIPKKKVLTSEELEEKVRNYIEEHKYKFSKEKISKTLCDVNVSMGMIERIYNEVAKKHKNLEDKNLGNHIEKWEDKDKEFKQKKKFILKKHNK
jgi:hypothetical protein